MFDSGTPKRCGGQRESVPTDYVSHDDVWSRGAPQGACSLTRRQPDTDDDKVRQ